MFTSDENRLAVFRTALMHLIAAVFCAAFGAVYEQFSHGVYSYFMLYAFALPLALGALPLLAMALYGAHLPRPFAWHAWSAGIGTLCVGSLMQGVLEIYGTTNRLAALYPMLGAALLILGLMSFLRSAGEGNGPGLRTKGEGNRRLRQRNPMEELTHSDGIAVFRSGKDKPLA